MLSAAILALALVSQCGPGGCAISQGGYTYMSNPAYYGEQGGGGFHPFRAVGRALFGGQARFNGGIQTASPYYGYGYSYVSTPTRYTYYTQTSCPAGGVCAPGVCQTGGCNMGAPCPMGVCQTGTVQYSNACYVDQYGRMVCPAQPQRVVAPQAPSKTVPSPQSSTFDIVPSSGSKDFESLKNFTSNDKAEFDFVLTSFQLDDPDNVDFKLY